MSTPVVSFRGCADGATVLEKACFLLETTADRVLLSSSSPNDSADTDHSHLATVHTDPKERKAA